MLVLEPYVGRGFVNFVAINSLAPNDRKELSLEVISSSMQSGTTFSLSTRFGLIPVFSPSCLNYVADFLKILENLEKQFSPRLELLLDWAYARKLSDIPSSFVFKVTGRIQTYLTIEWTQNGTIRAYLSKPLKRVTALPQKTGALVVFIPRNHPFQAEPPIGVLYAKTYEAFNRAILELISA